MRIPWLIALGWIGLTIFTVGIGILLYTRWGQYRPLRKCMVLSLLAHLVLATYAATVRTVAPRAAGRAGDSGFAHRPFGPLRSRRRRPSRGIRAGKAARAPDLLAVGDKPPRREAPVRGGQSLWHRWSRPCRCPRRFPARATRP